MQIIKDKTEFKLNEETAVVIGKFDGIHKGHQILLEEILKAKNFGLKSVVFTFEPSVSVFLGLEDGMALTTKSEKRSLLSKMGVDYLIEFPAVSETMAISAEDFITTYLRDYLHARIIVCTEDLSFGYKGLGNLELMKKYEGICGFKVKQLEKLWYKDEVISSSRIRKTLSDGNLDQVGDMLGRPYSFIGKIMHGAHLGTSIGFPTINLIPEDNKILPEKGVYYSETQIHGDIYRSITNIGYKPTVNNENQITIETYIYDFDEDVYGEEALVSIKAFKRPEMKFNGIEELKAALLKDIEDGKMFGK